MTARERRLLAIARKWRRKARDAMRCARDWERLYHRDVGKGVEKL